MSRSWSITWDLIYKLKKKLIHSEIYLILLYPLDDPKTPPGGLRKFKIDWYLFVASRDNDDQRMVQSDSILV